MQTIKNWFVVEHEGFVSIRGELWEHGRMLFSLFDTYNPTVISADQTLCDTSIGKSYRLENRKAFA